MNIWCALKDTFGGTPSTNLGLMLDISKMDDSLEDARSGCDKIDDTSARVLGSCDE